MKFALKIAVWILLLGGVVALFAFTNKANKLMLCKDVIISINYDEDNYFVATKDILQMAYQKGDSLKGQSMNSINVYSLENMFNTHPSIQNTEVYKTINGEVYINVNQRRPIARVINYKGEGYYFDSNGKLMPLSENYSARVPVFTGEIPYTFGANYNRNFKNEFIIDDSLDMGIHLLNSIYHVAQYIDKSSFWRAQIEQVNIVDNDFVLIPRVGDNKIIFGDAKDTEKKFEKLMIFYTEGLSKTGWNKYSIINLKFENQVVCTKANTPLLVSTSKEIVEPKVEAKTILLDEKKTSEKHAVKKEKTKKNTEEKAKKKATSKEEKAKKKPSEKPKEKKVTEEKKSKKKSKK